MAEPPRPSEVGGFIGSYRLLERRGVGGMGEVFLAHDDRLRRNVAIKRILPGAMGPEHRERLRREARAAAGLNHPAVVQVYDIVEEATGDSIVMEFVEGRTLTEMIREGALEVGAAVEVLLQVADGLEAAHQRGLIHRDLKGENVIVTAAGDAKILDFGVAKSTDPAGEDQTLTTAGAAVGTCRSMSPEQCEGGEIDSRSDLFSLGVLMYEMFGGRTPFGGKTPLQTLARVLGYDPPPVKDLNGSVPKDLSDLIEELLEKTADDRPASAAAVASRLEAFRNSAVLGGVVMPHLTDLSGTAVDPGASKSGGSRSQTRRRRGTRTHSAVKPSTRARNTAIAVVAVLGVAAGAIVVLGRGATADLSPTRVMVFPLAAGVGDAASTAGEDAATMIGTALNGTDPLEWIDAWPLLDADARADIRSIQLSEMVDLAQTRRAAHFIWGRIVPSGDSVSVVLNLYESRSGDAIAAAESMGESTAPWRAGLSAVNGLLPELIRTEVPDLESSFAARPPLAVAEFLLGEQAFRRLDMAAARTRFQAAFAADTTFVLAGLRGASAASWEHEYDPARELLRAVLRQPLALKTEIFAQGLLGHTEYDAERAIENLNQALRMDSSSTVAWAALGEVYRHRAPREPWLSGPRPFARALAQDSTAGFILFHSLEEVLRAGDLATARRLLGRFLVGEPDAGPRDQIDVMLRCVESGPLAGDWRAEVERRAATVELAGVQLLVGASNLPCGEAFMRAVLVHDTIDHEAEVRYWAGMLGLTGSKLARRRFDDVRRIVDAAAAGFEPFQSLIDRSTVDSTGVVFPASDAPWTPREMPLRGVHEESLTRWSEFAVLLGALYPELSDLAERGAAHLRATVGPDFERPAFRTTVWMLGLWEAQEGRVDEAARAVEKLREMAVGRGEFDEPYSHRMADVLEIHRSLALGDTAGALADLRALRANAPEGPIFIELIAPFAYERLVLARLEESAGNLEAALNLVRGFDEPHALSYILYVPHGLAACVRAATALGQNARAAQCQARLTDLGWSLADL